MTQTIIWTVAILTVLGLLLALILFWVARRFRVEEDPRIDEVEKAMPGANCGGCGFAGCRAFADAAVKAPNLDNHYCPVGGDEVMQKVASILGLTVEKKAPQVAVVRCNGSCTARPRTNEYDGVRSCRVKAALYSGDTACSYGCVGCGDCVEACRFGALSMDPETGLPVVDEAKCLPEAHHRAPEQGPARHARIRVLRQQGQGPCGQEGLRQRLHRLRPVCADLPARRHHRDGQRVVHRFHQMQTLPGMRGGVPVRRHPRREFPERTGQGGRQEAHCRPQGKGGRRSEKGGAEWVN